MDTLKVRIHDNEVDKGFLVTLESKLRFEKHFQKSRQSY